MRSPAGLDLGPQPVHQPRGLGGDLDAVLGFRAALLRRLESPPPRHRRQLATACISAAIFIVATLEKVSDIA